MPSRAAAAPVKWDSAENLSAVLIIIVSPDKQPDLKKCEIGQSIFLLRSITRNTFAGLRIVSNILLFFVQAIDLFHSVVEMGT